MYNELAQEGMSPNWKQGVIAFIRKSGNAEDLKNYRRVKINTIYKILDSTITRRRKPTQNLRTSEMRRGYKIKKIYLTHHLPRKMEVNKSHHSGRNFNWPLTSTWLSK